MIPARSTCLRELAADARLAGRACQSLRPDIKRPLQSTREGRRPVQGSLRWLHPKPKLRGGSTGEVLHGASRFHHAWASRVRRPFRPPVAPLEPENGALHLRHPQQHPHHRSRPDRSAAASGAEGGVRHRGQGRPRAVRRHQAPGAGADRRRRQALRPVLHQFPLARRHADQLEDHFGVDLSACARSTTNSAPAPPASPRKSA